MYHCRWTICPRGYLSGSNYLWMTRKGITSNTPWYFLDFTFYHYPCTTAGGQFVPEGTCRVVIIYEWREKESPRIPLGTFSILLFTTTHVPLQVDNLSRGYLSGSNYLWMTRKGITSNTPWYFLDFTFYHYPCTTAGGQFVPEGTCRVVIIYEWREKESPRIPLGTFSILLFTTTHVPLQVDNLSPRVLVG